MEMSEVVVQQIDYLYYYVIKTSHFFLLADVLTAHLCPHLDKLDASMSFLILREIMD